MMQPARPPLSQPHDNAASGDVVLNELRSLKASVDALAREFETHFRISQSSTDESRASTSQADADLMTLRNELAEAVAAIRAIDRPWIEPPTDERLPKEGIPKQFDALIGTAAIEADARNREHFLWSYREIYRTFGRPDDVAVFRYADGQKATVRWSYADSGGATVLSFVFIEGFVMDVDGGAK